MASRADAVEACGRVWCLGGILTGQISICGCGCMCMLVVWFGLVLCCMYVHQPEVPKEVSMVWVHSESGLNKL